VEYTADGTVSELPLACTLDAGSGALRLQRWRALAEQSPPELAAASKLEVFWRLDASGTDELHALTTSERECCAFVTWSVSRQGPDTVLAITAAPGRGDDLDAIAALFPAS